MTVAATINDEFLDGYIRSVLHTLSDRFTDGLKSVSIFQAGNFFFGAQIPFVKPSANGFFVFPIDIAMECGITDERLADGRIPSVI